MKDLSAKTQRNWPKDLPQDPEDQQSRRSRDTMGAAKLADGLAAGAERIPASVTTATMSEADRAGFQAEADTLRDQALRLGQAARTNQVEQMQESLDAISATCISCHSRYRDFSGQLITRQSAGDRRAVQFDDTVSVVSPLKEDVQQKGAK
jgi:phage-related protein